MAHQDHHRHDDDDDVYGAPGGGSSAVDSSLGSADSGSESGTLSTGGGYTDGPRAAKGFPVQILPYLYLGNAQNAEDEEALRRHSIQVSPARSTWISI
jgi:hypothetical protein